MRRNWKRKSQIRRVLYTSITGLAHLLELPAPIEHTAQPTITESHEHTKEQDPPERTVVKVASKSSSSQVKYSTFLWGRATLEIIPGLF